MIREIIKIDIGQIVEIGEYHLIFRQLISQITEKIILG